MFRLGIQFQCSLKAIQSKRTIAWKTHRYKYFNNAEVGRRFKLRSVELNGMCMKNAYTYIYN